MKFNSIIISLLTLALLASFSFAMANKPKLPEKKWDPAVQGIKLGSKFEEVISALGKPRSRKDNETGIVILYEGLTIEINSRRKDSLWVSRIEISSPMWKVRPDIKVGMLKTDVVKILGPPLHQEERENGRIWMWWWHESPKFDSLFSVAFETGRAIKIIFSEDKSL